MIEKILDKVTKRPKTIVSIVFFIAIAFLLQFAKIRIDTDPENMLSASEPVRVFHHKIKKEFSLYDFIVLGVVREDYPLGVFNKDSLKRIYDLTEKIKRIDGVITSEIIAPSTTDNIRQGGLGAVKFEWLMKKPPKTDTDALMIRDEALDNPVLKGTLVSDDGKAIAMFIPIIRKNVSYRVASTIEKYIDELSGPEKFYITGLPVAEDTFGVEMFKQMAISAPLAGVIIFLLMWFFFKKINLILSPMLLAIVTVISTMGLLIGSGFTVHIMSSMIPIFLMPISVVDSVHILSEFFDNYQRFKDRKKTIMYVMKSLFMPMLLTSVTTMAGFASLATTHIPPVRVFGIFVAIGVGIAWVLTIVFIPAFIMLIPEKSLKNFGNSINKTEGSFLSKGLIPFGKFAQHKYKAVLTVTFIILVISVYGITKIEINDNPVKWFTKSHKIRIADKILNKHFAGTYTAYLVFENQSNQEEVFKEPRMLKYVESLQNHISKDVGKTTSLADLVKKIFDELLGGDHSNYKIPSSKPAVAQCLISFQNSHRPDDLWHLTNPSYSSAILWVQLKSGDNKDMERVERLINQYIKNNPPPFKMKTKWAGLTYINTVWQDKMVKGMLEALLSSFVIVFILMILLFRSFLWGLLSMVPLSFTISFIYGLIGLVGKDYDMPVAVLSSLTLGLSVDFAIHFLSRLRAIYLEKKNLSKSLDEMFGEPALAISRNAIVIAIGFLPLLVTPLVPYRTVGFFLATIMFISGITTILILPGLILTLKKFLFKKLKEV